MPPAAASAPASAVRSSSELDFVFGSAATMASREAPIADASAEAEPPPGVGWGEAKAASTSRRDWSINTMDIPPARGAPPPLDVVSRGHSGGDVDHATAFHDRANGLRADANEIDCRSGDDDRVHL